MYIQMSKIISVSDEVYELLRRMKGEKSFRVVIKDLAGRSNKERVLSFAGMLSDEEAEDLKKSVEESRKRFNEGFRKSLKKVEDAYGMS